MDYTDLNGICPKDSFPLPLIDQIVDASAGHGMLSFLDAFSGYHQILMHPSDAEKTSFITPNILCCYNAHAAIKAILQSSAPTSKKEIQQLTGRLAALGRFISRFTNRLKPFFTTLRGANRAKWDEECDQELVAIKQYLTEPPILVSPGHGDTLSLPCSFRNSR